MPEPDDQQRRRRLSGQLTAAAGVVIAVMAFFMDANRTTFLLLGLVLVLLGVATSSGRFSRGRGPRASDLPGCGRAGS